MRFKRMSALLAILLSSNSPIAQTGSFDYASIKSAAIAFAQPIHDPAYLDGKMMADIIARKIADIADDKRLHWRPLPFAVSTVLSRQFASNTEQDIQSLPAAVIDSVRRLGVDYVILIHNVTAEKSANQTGAPETYFPLRAGITITGDGETEVNGKLSFSTTVISVASNSRVYTSRMSPELCNEGPEQCVALNVVKNITSKRQTPLKTIAETGHGQVQPAIQKYNAGSALFVAGSVLTFIGLGTAVSGGGQAGEAAAISLFAAGQTGLLLCGVSNYMIRSAITSSGDDAPGGKAVGWVLQGSSIILIGTGLGLISSAMSRGADGSGPPAQLMSGIFMLGAGEVLLPVSWVFHVVYRCRLKNIYQNVSFEPTWRYEFANKNRIGLRAALPF